MKKGFTLVELLAVIAILAILVIIALPNIMNMFNSAKKSTFVSEAKIIYGAAEQEYVKDSFSSSGKRVYAKSPEKKCAKELDANIKDNLYYYIEIDSSGKVTKFYMYDDSYQYSKEKYDLKKSDIDTNEVYDSSEAKEKIVITCDDVLYISNDSNNADNEYAFMIDGENLNIRMKKIANPDLTDVVVNTEDQNIVAIKRSPTPPSEDNMQEINIVSTSASKKPVYMWYDINDKTLYYYTEASKILLNKDCTNTFRHLRALTDISGLSDFDTSNVTNMSGMFSRAHSLEDISPIANWNTKRVTNMSSLFLGTRSDPMIISSLKPLSNWDTSSLTDMSYTFQCNIGYTTLEGLENWDTSKVTSLFCTFLMNKNLTTLKGIENFDTSNVTNMSCAFHECHKLTDASAIENWDVSKVEYMYNMFNISDKMSPKYSSLKKLDLSKWNMVNVKSYRWWVESLTLVSMEVTIRSTKVQEYNGMFQDTANYCSDANHTNYSCQIVVNYTSETEELVDKMIATKSKYSNVVKGRLVE